MKRCPLVVAAASHPGRRQHQEDRHLARLCRAAAVLVVADGMGGHAAGEVASGLAVAALDTAVRRGELLADPVAGLGSAARQANARILAHAAAHPESEGLGTTLVAAVARDGRVALAHAGDSRAWLVTPQDLVQLTRDHSAVQAALDAGTITEGEVAASPYRHAILRNLGDAEYPGLEHGEVELPAGSILLLTSDGAHGFLSPAEILDHLSGTANLAQGLDHLLRLAYHNGSDDNITLVACEAGAFPRSARPCQEPARIPAPARPRPGGATRALVALLALLLVLSLAGLALALWRGLTAPSGPPTPVAAEGGSTAPAKEPVAEPSATPEATVEAVAGQHERLFATAVPRPTPLPTRPRPSPTPEEGEEDRALTGPGTNAASADPTNADLEDGANPAPVLATPSPEEEEEDDPEV